MSGRTDDKTMGWMDLLAFGRAEIKALHKTWMAFFLTFYVWFNMAPLVSTIIKDTGLTLDQLKVLAICNVALTVPTRVLIGMLCDRIGPRKTFCIVMWTMAFPCIWFAFATSYTEMLISRLILSASSGFLNRVGWRRSGQLSNLNHRNITTLGEATDEAHRSTFVPCRGDGGCTDYRS